MSRYETLLKDKLNFWLFCEFKNRFNRDII